MRLDGGLAKWILGVRHASGREGRDLDDVVDGFDEHREEFEQVLVQTRFGCILLQLTLQDMVIEPQISGQRDLVFVAAAVGLIGTTVFIQIFAQVPLKLLGYQYKVSEKVLVAEILLEDGLQFQLEVWVVGGRRVHALVHQTLLVTCEFRDAKLSIAWV